MLEWYSNDKVGIFFSEVPKVCIRYMLPSSSIEEKKSIKKYPFINKKTIKETIKIFPLNTKHKANQKERGKPLNYRPKNRNKETKKNPKVFTDLIKK